jgi:hypothetical protein
VDAAWAVAALVAASVSAQEAINADDQSSRVVSNANRRVFSPLRRPHPRKPTCQEAPARPIRALRRGRHGVADTSTGLEKAPMLLLDSKSAGAFWGVLARAHFRCHPQNAIGTIIGAADGDALIDLCRRSKRSDCVDGANATAASFVLFFPRSHVCDLLETKVSRSAAICA